MRDGENQEITVRLLPEGVPYSALFRGLNGRLLRIDVARVPSEPHLNVGDLVEIASLRYLYLGQVILKQPETVVIDVEHALDRAVLAQIQQVWEGPAVS